MELEIKENLEHLAELLEQLETITDELKALEARAGVHEDNVFIRAQDLEDVQKMIAKKALLLEDNLQLASVPSETTTALPPPYPRRPSAC